MATSRLLNTLHTSSVALLLGLFTYSAEAKSFSGFGAEVDSYIRIAAHRYQVSEAMLRGLVKFEDGWTGKISPTGATGVGQFTVGTWNWLAETPRGRQLGMHPVTKYNRGTGYDPRRSKYINTMATALLARHHIEQFAERGIQVTDENLYMAHNIGLDGLHRALLGKSTKKDVKNMRLNGMKPWQTVSDFIAYQKNRYTQHKYAANFKTSPRTVVAKAGVVTASAHSASSSHQPVKAKVAKLALPSKIRYVEPNKSSGKVNWVEPNHNRIVWVSSKNQ